MVNELLIFMLQFNDGISYNMKWCSIFVKGKFIINSKKKKCEVKL